MSKTKISYPLRNEHDRRRVIHILSNMPLDRQDPHMITITRDAEQRRNKQNRLAFMWYKELGASTGHGAKHERRRCKLHHGVLIMREDQEFNSMWDATMGSLLYEQQLMAMDYMDVTSLMSVKQFARYLTDIDNESVENGHYLTHPDDLYWDSLMRRAPQHAT